MQESFFIELENCRFFARHGVFPEERVNGNEFLLNVRVEIPVADPEADDLVNTLSYADIYCIAEREMAEPRNLLETVAFRIGREIRERFPGVRSMIIRLTKTCPPIENFNGVATVEYLYSADN